MKEPSQAVEPTSTTNLMKFQQIEFSWRAAFIGFYMTPERDKVRITLLPFVPLYFKKIRLQT